MNKSIKSQKDFPSQYSKKYGNIKLRHLQQNWQVVGIQAIRPAFHPHPNRRHLPFIPQTDSHEPTAHLRPKRQVHFFVHSYRPATFLSPRRK